MTDREEPGPVSEGAGGRVARRLGLAGAVVVAGVLIATATTFAFVRHSTDGRRPQGQHSKTGAACGLRVVESAVSRKDRYSDGVRNPDNDQFLASAIVENPCQRAAINATFVVLPLNSHGRQLESAGQPVQSYFTIRLIMPGRRAAGWTYFTRQEAPEEIANLKVQREVTRTAMCWIAPAASGERAAARATDVVVGRRNASRSVLNGLADVSFKITWSPATSAPGRLGASVIFRDSSGRLMDANGPMIGKPRKRGQRERFVAWVPAKADPARTEVILEPEPNIRTLPASPPPSCLIGP